MIFLRVILDQVPGQQRQVARRGGLLQIGQAGCIAERGPAHPQGAGPQGHHLGKPVFVAAH